MFIIYLKLTRAKHTFFKYSLGDFFKNKIIIKIYEQVAFYYLLNLSRFIISLGINLSIYISLE